ncbi:LPXTG cell wall anchor domain-containing protein [Micromonospora sp. NPDC092111]|uniref:LPXTG cell wall anchor domain-containing protein n=1 Tax=Micromonospora sp. NPDC092111 TaxID=3364289 RepID=UPI00382594D4
MNRLKFRRVAAVTAGALIGLAGVATVASPALAHHPEPSGTYCAQKDGRVTVNWSVGNSEGDLNATITKLESSVPGEFSGALAVGAALPKKGDGPLAGSQTHTFTGKLPELKLTVEARWERRDRIITEERTVIAQPAAVCAPTESPSPSPTSPAPTETPETPGSPSPSPSTTSASPSPSSPAATPPAEPAEPVFRLEETCDTMTFIVENPAKGVPFTATLTTEKGVTKKLESTPGKTGTVSFDAYPGLKVTVSYDVVEGSETIEYTQPEDCGDGEGGGLPLTGSATTTIAAGAALLLAAGAVMYVVARRRRVRFTA